MDTLALEIDCQSGSIISASGAEKLDFEKRSFDSLQNQPLDAAFYLHSAIYKAHPDIRSICHTHSKYVSILTSLKTGIEIKPVHQNSCRFLKNVKVDGKYGGIATSQSAEGARVAQLLETGDEVMLLANHGAITVGRNVAVAFD